MFKLIIKKQDLSTYWQEYFNSLEELNSWLDEEKTRLYWLDSFSEEIIDLRPEAQSDYEQKQLETAWSELRCKRNGLLSESDYTQLEDAPISSEKKQEYSEYRQELRDLPDNTLDPLNPVFPSKPS